MVGRQDWCIFPVAIEEENLSAFCLSGTCARIGDSIGSIARFGCCVHVEDSVRGSIAVVVRNRHKSERNTALACGIEEHTIPVVSSGNYKPVAIVVYNVAKSPRLPYGWNFINHKSRVEWQGTNKH